MAENSEQAAAGGRVVSCRKGCGACCRQLVPLAWSEAYQPGELVNALPEPRRTDCLTARPAVQATGCR